MQTAAEVWNEISKQFSGKTNKMQVTRILHEMRHLRQGQRSVTEYAGELKRLYRDLEFFHPFKSDDPKGGALLREWFQPILVHTFLEGLNAEFDFRRKMIYSATNWPSLEEAISSILEETQISNQGENSQANTDARAALSSQAPPKPPLITKDDQANATKSKYRRKTKLVCDHCKESGHIKKYCFELVGYPPGWQQQQYARHHIGDARGIKQDRVHLTSSAGELPAVAAQALEEFKSKLMASSTDGPSASTSSFHASRGVNQSQISNSSNNSWIIDSGATNHMTGSPKEFSSYVPRSGKDRVRIADGSYVPIMGSGTISCTPSLPLTPVLHVPNFPVNLLSVSSITKSLNCRAWFEPSFCVFQELKTGKVLGTETEHDGLYYLDNAASPLALSAHTTSAYELLLLHRRFGHLSFRVLARLFPSLFASCYKDKLVCDACELAKHTRATYPSSSERSQNSF